MPSSGALCKKCKSGLAAEGDSWCALCSSATALSEASKHRFSSLAHRALAEEVSVQASRQVRALIQLDRQVDSERTSLNDRLKNAKVKLAEVTNQVDKSAAPKSAGARPVAASPGPAAPVKAEAVERDAGREALAETRPPASAAAADEADCGSESFEEESEEEEPVRDRAEEESDKRSAVPPRSPSRPPLPRAEPKKKRRHRSRSRGRRGGKKHQQHFRGLDAPDQRFHHRHQPEPINLGGNSRGWHYYK